jgi:membrane dipeptidase
MTHASPRITVLAASAALLLAACAPSTSTTAAPMPSRAALPDVSDRAWRVYREAWVVDTHNDMPDKIVAGYDPDVRHPAGFGDAEGHTDLPRLRESGLHAVFLSAWVDAVYATTTPDSSFERAMLYVDSIHAFVRRHPDHLLLATTAAEVRQARELGKVAVLVGVEGGHAIEGSLDHLRTLHGRGVRYLTLTWNNGNAWAGSSIGVGGTRTGGLTEFGREVIGEMNRLGMLVDLSHVSEATFFDALKASRSPVIASHSSARALADHPRNLTDDQLRAIARNGGVVNINFFSRFLDGANARARDAIEAETAAELSRRLAVPGVDPAAVEREIARERRQRVAALPPVPLSVLIDHFDHVARVAGADHVGIGSDFDGVSGLPHGMEDVTHLPRIAEGLLARGWSEADVKKMLGGNMMRVMQQVLDRRVAPDR